MSQIIPTAEPFFFPGDPRKPACLLIHGFTGTPKEMRELGEFLNGRGFTCLGVRLTGHATAPEDMIRSRYTDWIASVEDGYRFLRGVSDRVFFCGLSMGGVLALLTSTRLAATGVIAMSTPFQLPFNYPVWLLQLLSAFKRYAPKGSAAPGSGWFDQAAYRDHISYSQNPIRSAAELQKLLANMRATLPDARTPVLLIHSKDDDYVPADNLEKIRAALINATKTETLLISGSGHVVTRDAARRQVFEAALQFIQENA